MMNYPRSQSLSLPNSKRNSYSANVMRLCIVLAGFLMVCVTTSNATLAVQTSKPNIILLNFDDADMDILSTANLEEHYPTMAALARRSTVFTNAHATTPFCAPSRAALFTGKYAFNNGCKIGREADAVSNGFEGGYQRFLANGHDDNELGVWMKRAGYRTMHVGKFHHDGFANTLPPGFDDFSATKGMLYYNTARYTNIAFSPARGYQTGASTYVVDVDRADALKALNSHFSARPTQPFFLSLAPIAPHTPAVRDVTQMVEARYKDYASGLTQPTDAPDYDEADFSDKPSTLQRGPLNAGEKRYFDLVYISRLRAMKSVDDMLNDILARITSAGKMNNTYVIISSDNGFQLGHHRAFAKKDPFDRSTRVPLIVAGPQTTQRREANHLIAQLDICPTILELGGATIPADLDGKSFAPLINSPQSTSARNWQRSIMIENWADKNAFGIRYPLGYTAERYYDSIYVGWANGEREYYDLASDPYQLNNQYNSLSDARKEQLQTSLRNFRSTNVAPAITLLSPVRGEPITDQLAFKGLMEDNSAAVAALVTIKSVRTNRFFNGTTWQDDFTAITVPSNDPSNNINTWDATIGVFSEKSDEFDFILSWAHPLDDSQRRGDLKWTFNVMRDRSLYGQFNPTINNRTFTNKTIQLLGYHGRFPNTTIQLTVMDKSTGKYFNGVGFQAQPVELETDVLNNNRWRTRLMLPPGDYRSTLQASGGGFTRPDLQSVEFSVR